MNHLTTFLISVLLMLASASGHSQDRPLAVNQTDAARVEAALAPFVQMGRESYASARARYLAGLPRGYQFYVTVALRDSEDRVEQAFVAVDAINGDTISGIIASDPVVVSGYSIHQPVSLNERAVLDWTVVRPDGTEEGNFVGRFVDHYRPGKVFVAVFGFEVSEAGRANNVRLAMVSDDSGEPLDVSLPPAWLSAAVTQISAQTWGAQVQVGKEVFVPYLYDPEDPRVVRASR